MSASGRRRLVGILLVVLSVAGGAAWWRATRGASGGLDAGAPPRAGAPGADNPSADSAAEAAPHGLLSGRIVHAPSGPPVEITLAGAALPPPQHLRRVHANAAGDFQFDSLPDGVYALRAEQGQAAAFVGDLEVPPAAQDGGTPLLEIELRATVALSGRLWERGGGPIVGGEVALVEETSSAGFDSAALLARRAASGDGGGFHFSPEPGGYRVLARADGFLPSPTTTLAVSAKPAPVEIALDRSAAVEGRLVGEDGRPIAGAALVLSGESEGGVPIAVSAPTGAEWPRLENAAVRLQPAGELGVLPGPIPFAPAPSTLSSASEKSLLSDGRGVFRVTGVPPGKLVISASHPDFARATSKLLELAAGQTAEVELVLVRGRAVRGRVVDDRGLPLAGAEIVVGEQAVTVSNARGEWRLEHQAGAVALGVRLSGYLPEARTLAEDVLDTEVQLTRAEGSLSGVVLDTRDDPVSGATLELSQKRVASARDGTFHLTGLGAGPYRVRVEHPDFAPLEVLATHATDDLRVVLAPGGGVSGEVREARTGATPPSVRVTLLVGGQTRLLMVRRGRFEAVALPVGKATLSAISPGFVPWSRQLDVPAGDHPREVTVRDVRVELERGGSIFGSIVDGEGEPVPDAVVESGETRGRSDARGDYRLDGIAPGRAHIRVEWSGRHADENVEVREGDDSRADLRLR